MSKLAVRPKCLSTDASMLADILQPFKEPTWIQASLNARIAGNRITQLSCAKYKDLDVLNAIVPTSPKTTVNLGSIAKWTKCPTLHDLKQRKRSHVLTHLSVWTAEEITKLILTCVHSGDIDSIGSGNKRSTLRSVKTGPSRFVLWRTANLNYDHEKSQNVFTKHLEKLPHYQYHSWDSKPVQHYLHPRTPLVWNL